MDDHTDTTTLDLIHRFDRLEAPDKDDAQRLANYLIENESDRETWPGNLLYCFIVNAYDRDGFRSFDLDALARIIEGILIQHDGLENELAATSIEPSSDDPLTLPELAHFDQLGLNLAEGCPEMFFTHMQCDCLDWQSVRRKLPPTSPGRLCKHLSRIIHVNIGQVPPISEPLRRLLAWAGHAMEALPPQPDWELMVDEPESMLAASGDGKTIVIFADADAGEYKRFTYLIADRQWADNRRPTQIDHPALRSVLSRFIASESAA